MSHKNSLDMLFSLRMSNTLVWSECCASKLIMLPLDYFCYAVLIVCFPPRHSFLFQITHLVLRCIGISPLIIHGIIRLCCMYAQLNSSHQVSLCLSHCLLLWNDTATKATHQWRHLFGRIASNFRGLVCYHHGRKHGNIHGSWELHPDL